MTQGTLAKALGVHKNTVASYEAGKPVPSDVLQRILAHYMQVSPAWLLTGEGSMLRTETREPQGDSAEVQRLQVVVSKLAAKNLDLEARVIELEELLAASLRHDPSTQAVRALENQMVQRAVQPTAGGEHAQPSPDPSPAKAGRG